MLYRIQESRIKPIKNQNFHTDMRPSISLYFTDVEEVFIDDTSHLKKLSTDPSTEEALSLSGVSLSTISMFPEDEDLYDSVADLCTDSSEYGTMKSTKRKIHPVVEIRRPKSLNLDTDGKLGKKNGNNSDSVDEGISDNKSDSDPDPDTDPDGDLGVSNGSSGRTRRPFMFTGIDSDDESDAPNRGCSTTTQNTDPCVDTDSESAYDTVDYNAQQKREQNVACEMITADVHLYADPNALGLDAMSNGKSGHSEEDTTIVEEPSLDSEEAAVVALEPTSSKDANDTADEKEPAYDKSIDQDDNGYEGENESTNEDTAASMDEQQTDESANAAEQPTDPAADVDVQPTTETADMDVQPANETNDATDIEEDADKGIGESEKEAEIVIGGEGAVAGSDCDSTEGIEYANTETMNRFVVTDVSTLLLIGYFGNSS